MELRRNFLKRKNLLFKFFVFFLPFILFSFLEIHADIIRFKNGSYVEGLISERSDGFVDINIGSGIVTFRKDEIAGVEKKEFNPPSDKDRDRRNRKIEQLMSRIRFKSGVLSRYGRFLKKPEKMRLKHTKEMVVAYKKFGSNRSAGNYADVKDKEFLVANEEKNIELYSAKLSEAFNSMMESLYQLEMLYKDLGGDKNKKYEYVRKFIDKYNRNWNEVDVPMKKDRFGGLWVYVKVNNKSYKEFMIDTGASLVVIPKKLAVELGVKREDEVQDIVLNMANGKSIKGRLVYLNKVEVSGMVANNVPAAVIDTSGEITPLLGMSYFKNFFFQIDLANKKLKLKKFQ